MGFLLMKFDDIVSEDDEDTSSIDIHPFENDDVIDSDEGTDGFEIGGEL